MKVSVLFGFLRIFPDKRFRYIVIGTIILTILWATISSAVYIFQCIPVSYFWTRWKGEASGKCISSDAIIWVVSIIGIVTDVAMLVMAVSQLYNTQMALRKKIIVTFMLSVGAL